MIIISIGKGGGVHHIKSLTYRHHNHFKYAKKRHTPKTTPKSESNMTFDDARPV